VNLKRDRSQLAKTNKYNIDLLVMDLGFSVNLFQGDDTFYKTYQVSLL